MSISIRDVAIMFSLLSNVPYKNNSMRDGKFNINRQRALKNGELCYYGKPCRKGHDGLRYARNGRCKKCNGYTPTGGKVGGKPDPYRSAAIQNNEPFYNNGKPCKQGHAGKRDTATSLCIDCKEYRRLKRKPKNRKYDLAKFGLTVEQYDELLQKQNGVCAICKRPETIILNWKLKPLAVDHCHETNRIRGLLCAQCNVGIGNLKHNPDWLRAAALYCEAT